MFTAVGGARDAVYIGRGWVINHEGSKIPYRKVRNLKKRSNK